MQVAEVDFNGIISPAGTQFTIPNWQRVYSWDRKEWDDLWEDIASLYEKVKQGQPSEHFLGPVVLKTDEEKVGEITRRTVIDGQQRLSTLLVICSILRNMARSGNNEKLAKEIEGTILFNEYAKRPEYRPKLRASQADRKALSSICDGEVEEKIDQGSQLAGAYSFFAQRLNETKEQYTIDGLLNLIRNLKIVTINLGERDNPNRIFETLNFRGKELDQVDLVRNYFMMAVGGSFQVDRLYDSLWYPMQEAMGSDTEERIGNMKNFLRHYAVMNEREFVRAKDVYAEIRKRTKQAGPREIGEELRRITEFATDYGKLLFPDRETDSEIRRGIERVDTLEVGVHYPFLLKVYQLFDAQRLTRSDVCNILATIESYFVRRAIRGSPTQGLNRYFAHLCSLPDDDLPNSLISELMSKYPWQSQYWPEDDAFRESLVSAPLYYTSACRLVLDTIEQDFGHPEPVDLDALTIEHIMPETLSDEWKHYLGKDWERLHNEYLHTLGNLTLIAGEKNSAVSNELFPKKKEIWYMKSNVELTKQIVREWTAWNEDSIKRRASVLADRACKIWSRPGPAA